MPYARPDRVAAIHTAHAKGQLTDRMRDAELALAEAMGAALCLSELAVAAVPESNRVRVAGAASAARNAVEDNLTPLFRLAAGI